MEFSMSQEHPNPPKKVRPTHRLGMLNKRNEERGTVGAGWKNDDGSITIQLNTSVVLTQSKDIVLTLFPDKPNESRRHTE